MTDRDSPESFRIDDATLVAYADGMLAGARRRRVERLLRCDPAVAARAAVYAEQGRRLRSLQLGLPMDDTVTFHPELVAAVSARLAQRRRARRMLAAAAFLLLAAGGLYRYASVPALPGDASVQVASAQAPHFTPPDLSAFGLRLVAEASLPRARVPATRLVYEDATGTPVYLLIGVARGGEAELFGTVPDGYVALEWREGPKIVALMAPRGRAWMPEVMETVRASLLTPPATVPAGAVVPAAGGSAPPTPSPARAERGASL